MSKQASGNKKMLSLIYTLIFYYFYYFTREIKEMRVKLVNLDLLD